MKRIYVQNGIVFFYGNPAGYLGDGKAVIDCMFQKEELVSFVKEQFLVEPVFREGVYDRLSEGGGVKETAEVSIGEGRRLRIYQLGQDSPIMMRFISLAERKKRGYDRPRREEYVRVYEGEIENYSLEEVWEKYGRRVPEDLVELTGESVEDTVIRQMEIETLQKAMQSLTPVQRERLHFYFFEGMTYRQIAAKEGVGEKNIRESINGAVKKIKKFFD